jgi:hypothetical protein
MADALSDALGEKPEILMLDHIDALTARAERDAVTKLVMDARTAAESSGKTLTVVVGTASMTPAEDWNFTVSVGATSQVLNLDLAQVTGSEVQA